MTGRDILRAVEATTPLINPRLAEIDWDDVAAALDAERAPRDGGLREALEALDHYPGHTMRPPNARRWVDRAEVLAVVDRISPTAERE